MPYTCRGACDCDPAERVRTSKPTDEQILEAVARYGSQGRASYVIRNCLGRNTVTTPWVLRQLKRLEREGKVERVPSCYAVMIGWRATPSLLAEIDRLNQEVLG